MKLKTKALLALGCSLVAAVCFATGCATADSASTNAPQGETYEWIFDKPFAGTVDENMKIDGKLDEDVWQNQKYIFNSSTTQAWAATTYFTKNGLYVGLKVSDDTMFYNTRYTSRSTFNLCLCKTGTETYNINSTAYHEGRCFEFQLDPYYCRSLGRVPYYYKAQLEGELNSETTCTMTAELFLTWEDLYYTKEELGENGYPEDIQMYINYRGESMEVLGTCPWREETYLHFDKDGYKTASEYEGDFAVVSDGLPSTDMWKKNEDGNYYTTAGRAQIMWIKNAYAKDFVFEVELKPLSKNEDGTQISLRKENVYGRFGLINALKAKDNTINTTDNKSVYSVYSADARSVSDRNTGSKNIKLMTAKQIDTFHWSNRIGLSEETVCTNWNEEAVVFRIIKQGELFYYFYGDTYWKSERIDTMQDAVYCGIFTSQGVEILDYTFTDYTGNENALKAEIEKYVYFVEVPGVSAYGEVTVNSYAVAKGESATVTFAPKSKGVLTQVTKNGEDVYDEVLSAMNADCEYTFVPTENTVFSATFSPFDGNCLVRTIVAFNDEKSLVKDANYEIRGNEKLLYYKGTPNSSGYIIIYLPKEGTYTVDGRTFNVSGEYSLFSSFSEHRNYTATFTLNDDTTSVDVDGKAESVAKDKSFTYHASVTENDWGTVIVNGVTLTGSGKLLYNAETGNYYIDGGVNRYYKTMVGDDEFELDVTLNVSNIGHRNNDLVGIQITNGKYLIVLKAHLENSSCLFIATGTGTSSTSREICITGFGWTRTQEPTLLVKGSGEISFKVVKAVRRFIFTMQTA